jgi:hypothetical protein
MERGTNALLERLGVLETEEFISAILRDPTDYTKWSDEYFADYDEESFLSDAVKYDKEHPFE